MQGIEIFTRVACSSCGVEFTARRRLDCFQILEKIAEGGTSLVYKAVESTTGCEVALKVLKAGEGVDATALERHESQALAIAQIEHPNIVRIFKIGHAEGRFYLAMEFLGGGSLDDLIQARGALPEALALSVGLQVAEGLAAALDCGLLHRDIKPANILFADSQTVKLVDFGLSAQPLGEVWGTPDYIAPEKLAEQPEDFRSDIYSLGATLFHALAGHAPCKTDNVPLEELQELKKHPINLRAAAPHVSEGAHGLLQRMLAYEPAGRHADYGELIAHFREALK